MPRVKRGATRIKKRKNVLKSTKGYMWGRKSRIKLAKTAVNKAGAYAYRDRRNRKRAMRRLWQTRLNAAVRQLGLTYSKFIHMAKQANVELDRKILSDIAVKHPDTFAKIVDTIKK